MSVTRAGGFLYSAREMSVPLFALLAVLQIQAIPEKGLAESRFSRHIASKIVAPIYAGSGDAAAAVVRVERAAHDLRRKGFFRVGVLPYISLQGVHLDVRDPEAAVKAVQELPRILKRIAKSSAVEVSDFRLSVGKKQIEVAAAKVRFDSATAITLAEVRVKRGADTYEEASGVLHLSGEKMGWIVLGGTNAVTELKIFGGRK